MGPLAIQWVHKTPICPPIHSNRLSIFGAVTGATQPFQKAAIFLKCHSLWEGHISDRAVVSGGDEVGFEVCIVEAVDLSGLCPGVELLALTPESDGRHAPLQLGIPVNDRTSLEAVQTYEV